MKIYSDNENNDKEKIKYFAEKAKEVITLNNFYHKYKERYEIYIREIKKILFDKENIKDNFININNKLKSNIEQLQQEYEKIKSTKYNIYYNNCTDDLEMGKPLLNQIKADKFALEQTLSQKDYMIKILTLNMKNSLIFTLFRQPKRDTFLDLKEGNRAIKDTIIQAQTNLLSNSKNFNAFFEKCKKDRKKIEQLENKIIQLKECVNILNIEKSKINQIQNTKQIISNQLSTISNLKTTDRTCSSNDNTPYKKNYEEKNNINKKFELTDNSIGKIYEEDIKYKNNNINRNNERNNDRNKNIITKALMTTVIPDSLSKNKYLSINAEINFEPLKNDIDLDIENSPMKNSEENKITFINKKALSAENRKTKISKKRKDIKKDKIIQSFQNLEELFQITDSENEKEEIIIDTVIHSDDETTLEKKVIQNKNICNSYLKQIKSVVPKINLDLIEFNKLKVVPEVDLYSLERRNYKNMSVEDNINMIRKKIKKLKKKININSKKVEVMKKFIDDLKNKYILFKRIKTQSSALNSKVNYISNHEIIDLNQVEEEENEDDIGSDYLNENDEITE